MSYEEFRRRIDTARNILVGAVPSPSGQIDQITYALIYKFMNDIDDKSASIAGGKRSFFTGEYEKYNWHALMASSLGAHERLELYRQAIQNMSKNEKLPPLFREIYQNAFLPFNSANVLNLFLKEMDKFDHSDSDDIGDAYEYLLSITGAQGDVGQFRTPRHIIKFIVEAINPTKDDSVLDPACGTAGFLISAYEHVKSQHDGIDESGVKNDEKRLTSDESDKIHKNYRGFDIDPTMVRTAEVNMYLHGFTTPDIRNHDTLSSEDFWDKKYDVILANPPFMTPKGGIQPHKKFSINANRAEVLFVDYIASHINPVSGRAGIVVPEGIIFQSGNAYKQLRKNLVEDSLYAVVSLPAGVFQPYSGVKTSILLLDKKLAKERDEILFVKIENDGYSLGAQRRTVGGNQFPEAHEIIERFKTGKELNSIFAHSISRKLVAESGDYNLGGDRYRFSLILSGGAKPIHLTRLENVAEIYQPKTITSNEILSFGEYKVYGANGVIGFYDKYNHENREVAITCRGATCGTINYTEPKSWVTGNAMIVSPKDENILDKRYLYFILGVDRLKNVISGSAQPQITRTSLAPFLIPLPPIEIQREIVTELDVYKKIIDAAQTIIQNYKPTIKINHEWKDSKLGNHLDVFSGYAFKSNLFNKSGEGMPLIRIRDVKPSNTKTYYSGEYDDKYIVNNDDLLIGMDGEFNPTMWRGGRALLNQRVCRLENFKEILAPYVLQIVRDELKKIEKNTYAVTVKHISSSQIKNINIKLPPIETQREIVAELEIEQKIIESNKKLIEIYQQKIKTKIAEIWGE